MDSGRRGTGGLKLGEGDLGEFWGRRLGLVVTLATPHSTRLATTEGVLRTRLVSHCPCKQLLPQFMHGGRNSSQQLSVIHRKSNTIFHLLEMHVHSAVNQQLRARHKPAHLIAPQEHSWTRHILRLTNATPRNPML